MRAGLRGTAAAALALALSTGVGCGSTGLGVVEGPDGAPDAEPPPDGDSPHLDGGGDARDARKDGLAPASGYCLGLVPKPRFCDDFDDLDLINNWDQDTVTPPSVMDLDDSTFTSAPVSFGVATKSVLPGSSANVHLRKTVLGNVPHVQLSFSAIFASTTLTQGLVAIATLDVSSSHYFTLYLRDGDPDGAGALEELVGGTKTRHVLTKLPPAGTWTRITLDLDLAAGKANVTFGAQKALDAAPITAIVGTEATVRLGAVYVYGPTDPFQASFDDVVVDF